MKLILYSGPHCELCDQVEAMLDHLAASGLRELSWQRLDVTTTRQLKKHYGLRIPVLYREDTNTELAWPFTEQCLFEFISDAINRSD